MKKKLKKKKKKREVQAQPPDKYAVLREDLETLPIKGAYPDLMKKLSINEKSVGDDVLRQLILECPEDKRLSGFIYAVAKDDMERVGDWYLELRGKWAEKAQAEIAVLKSKKLWAGSVYPSNIDEWIAANIPEWKEAKARLRDAKKICDTARRLWEAYDTRLSSLQTYARLTERHRGKSVAERNAQ